MMIAEIETEAAARQAARSSGDPPSGSLRIVRRAAYYLFVAAFRAAAERLKRGCKDAVFPDGCFPPPLPFCRSG